MKLNQFNEPDIQCQALAAGFATVELYIQNLLERDAKRLAIKNGIDGLVAGKHRQFRDEHGLESRTQ